MSPDKNKAPGRLTVQVNLPSTFAHDVERAGLQKAARAAFKAAGSPATGALTVIITDDAQIQELNRTFRRVDAPTDVLAFGEAGGASEFVPPPDEAKYWGDIVISLPRATEQAVTYGHPLQEELALLAVHGTLHLMGYDHEQADQKEEMWAVQKAALALLGIDWQP